jgi:long-subunit fatty acid transport protein
MSKRIFFSVLILVAITAMAQNHIPERLLLSTGQYLGPGARPLGMAGTYTGIADDFSSVWYNPAGIAQVKRIEMQASLSRSGYSNSTSYYGNPWDGTTSNIRLNNLGFVFPIPVYQGAFSFALGYNQLQSFDRRTRVVAGTGSNQEWRDFDELESGRLGVWNLSFAADVSPNLALGLGANYFVGADDYTLTGNNNVPTLHYTEQTINTGLTGWMINTGALLRIGQYARVGGMFQPSMSMLLKEDWTQDQSAGFFDYRMTYPAIFRVGASVAPGRWLLAADLEYRDWNTMEFRTEPPYSGVTRAEANQDIKNMYKSTTRVSIGGEYLFPLYGLRARAGYSYEPSAFEDIGKGDKNRGIFALGVGILVDRSVMLDVGYRVSSYRENTTPGLTEDIRSSTGLLTLSYRM